jgi:hypothetical protein
MSICMYALCCAVHSSNVYLSVCIFLCMYVCECVCMCALGCELHQNIKVSDSETPLCFSEIASSLNVIVSSSVYFSILRVNCMHENSN